MAANTTYRQPTAARPMYARLSMAWSLGTPDAKSERPARQVAMVASREGGGMEVQDLWYKDAIVYCLDVGTFQDGDGDGYGDFRGLSRRLEYLASLGVTCLWLLP